MGDARLADAKGTEAIQGLWEHFQENVAGYLLSSLVISVVYFVILMGLGLGMVGALLPGMIMEDPVMLQVGAIVAGLVNFGSVLLMAVVFPLMQASVMRAIGAHHTTGEPLGWSSPFTTFTQDALRVVGFSLLSGFMVGVASLFCFLPAIPVFAWTTFALPIMVLEQRPIIESLSRAGSPFV